METANRSNVTVLASFKDSDVHDVTWINNTRLYYTTADRQGKLQRSNGSVFAVDRDGRAERYLTTSDYEFKPEVTGSTIKRRTLPWDYSVVRPMLDGSDDVLVQRRIYDTRDYTIESTRLFRLNTRTQEIRDLFEGGQPENVRYWVLNPKNEVVFAVSWAKGRRTIHLKESGNWKVVGDFDSLSGEGFTPHFVDAANVAYVSAGQSKQLGALYRYNLSERKLDSDAFVEIEGFDYEGQPVFDVKTKALLGLRHLSDAWATTWVDSQMSAIQKKIDGKLPNTINTVSCGECINATHYLVESVSDRQAPLHLLYNAKADSLIPLGSTRPGIDPLSVGTRDFHRFEARDGLSIPVYVTQPPGAKKGPFPAIVLVHGGPYVRGSTWEWEEEAQFLASRGYLVIQPEFRGSEGFGFKHFQAGWRQWGLKMQDDLADAANWAVKQGFADPKRICIAGASYGGFATLMGLARNPELFRCGFQWVGVTDLALMFKDNFSDISSDSRSYSLVTLIGDPVKDAAKLRETSPIGNVQRIKQPVLMAYGGYDRRVPATHGVSFRDALQSQNDKVEWALYPDEGHGWYQEPTNLDFWSRVERFLDKNLKNPD